MAVLIEGISVVALRAKVADSYAGGWEQFVVDCPNKTLCADRDLARIEFMSPVDVEAFLRRLEAVGFLHVRNGNAADLVVVDQLRGPTSRCDWLEFGHVEIRGNRVATCRLAGSKDNTLITPDGWQYRESLSASYGFVPLGAEKKSLRFLRHEKEMDVYLNFLTGEEVYIGRTGDRVIPEDESDVPGKK